MYSHPDPGIDWERWCKDHPEPPTQDEVPEEFWLYTCPECGQVEYDETELKPNGVACSVCLSLVDNDGEYDEKAYQRWAEEGKL